MRSAVELYEHIKRKYDGVVNFKRICEDEGIVTAKAKLPEGIRGFAISADHKRVIVLNESTPYDERRDVSFHELYHILRDPSNSKRANDAADLFAALCRIPRVVEGDTVDSLVEQFNVTRRLAKIRLEYEIKTHQ